MENAIGIQLSAATRSEGEQIQRNDSVEAEPVKLTFLDWYRVLRVHHHWTIFQAIRFALWLAR